MSNDTIYVTGTVPGHVGLYERHAAHPNGECFVVGGEVSEVALTQKVQQFLNQGAIKRVDETDVPFSELQKLEQLVKDQPIGTKGWFRAQAVYQEALGNTDLALQLRGQGGYNPDVTPDAVLDALYAQLAPLEPVNHEYQHVVKQIIAREAEIANEVADADKARASAKQTESESDDQTPNKETDDNVNADDTALQTEEAKPKTKRGKA